MLLGYSEQSNSVSRSEKITEMICGIVLGLGCFACFRSAFALHWSPKEAFAGDPLGGMLSVCNSIADRLGETDYIILRRFAGGFTGDGSPEAQGMFLTILMVIMMIVCWLMVRSGNRLLLLIPVLPLAALMLLTGVSPGPWVGLAFAFALCCALAAMTRDRENLRIMALPLIAAVLSLGIGLAMDHSGGTAMSGWHGKLVEKTGTIAQKRYHSNPLGNGCLEVLDGKALREARGPMEDASKQLSKSGDGPTALSVNMEEPYPIYLRGFVGETYGSSKWSELGNDVYYHQRDQLFWLNQRGFDGLSQLSEARAVTGSVAEDADDETASGIGIEVRDADRSRIYIPYEATATDRSIPKGTENYAGGFLKSDRLLGSRSYDWRVMSQVTDRWTDLAGQLYSADKSEALARYFENESHYNVWCYQHYTAIPDDMKGLMEAAVGDPGDLSRNHADYKETIALIRDYLDGNFIYSEDFGDTEAGKDAVEEFLLSGKGCDAHYASLATLLFRWFGIPARYVEGYLVTPGDVSEAKAREPMDIGTSNCHAWTEIYIDGLGWVPLEVTTAYRDIMPEADMDKGLEAVAYENKPRNEESLAEEDMIVSSDPPQYGRIFLKLLLAGLAILILIILAWVLSRAIRRHLAIRRRQKAFADPDPRKGVCAMYGYLLEEKLPCGELATEIGDLAAFSNNEVDETHRAQMRSEIEWSENEKKTLDKVNRRTVGDRIFDLWNSLRRR